MKKLVLLSSAVLLATTYQAVQAQDELVYVAVEPCRVADTRQSDTGAIKAGTSRNFLVYGRQLSPGRRLRLAGAVPRYRLQFQCERGSMGNLRTDRLMLSL